MTRTQAYVAGGAALLGLWLLWPRKAAAAATGNVDLGEPTVTGAGADQFGGRDYGTTPVVTPDSQAFASDLEVQRLVDESTRAILENGGYPE